MIQNNAQGLETFYSDLIFENFEFIAALEGSDCAIRDPSETSLLSGEQRPAGRAIMTP